MIVFVIEIVSAFNYTFNKSIYKTGLQNRFTLKLCLTSDTLNCPYGFNQIN